MTSIISGSPPTLIHLIEYFAKNKDSIAMISLSVDYGDPFQYNYWNWINEHNQLVLLKDDYSIGHILYNGTLTINNDDSILYRSEYHPKNCVLNFYFGGVSN